MAERKSGFAIEALEERVVLDGSLLWYDGFSLPYSGGADDTAGRVVEAEGEYLVQKIEHSARLMQQEAAETIPIYGALGTGK